MWWIYHSLLPTVRCYLHASQLVVLQLVESITQYSIIALNPAQLIYSCVVLCCIFFGVYEVYLHKACMMSYAGHVGKQGESVQLNSCLAVTMGEL